MRPLDPVYPGVVLAEPVYPSPGIGRQETPFHCQDNELAVKVSPVFGEIGKLIAAIFCSHLIYL
jgi:hypothetical protein